MKQFILWLVELKGPKHTTCERERFLIGQNRTKRANFRISPLLQATYVQHKNRKVFCFYIVRKSSFSSYLQDKNRRRKKVFMLYVA